MQLRYPESFEGQFLICADTDALSQTATHRLTRTALAVQAPLPVVTVEDAAGRAVGLLLGVPISEEGRILRDRHRLDLHWSGDVDALVESEIYVLAGSFVFVLDDGDHRRLYLDACGSLSAVYDPERRRAAATSLQLLDPDEAQARFRARMYDALHIARDGWFPAGLTAHEGIWRLMPNHYLDLDSFEMRRHWPCEPIARAPAPEAACSTILSEMRRTMSAAAAQGPAYVSLTAGNETRMLVAAGREMRDALTFVTVRAEGVELDRIRAEELASRFDLEHRIIPLREADGAAAQDWHARTGYTFGGPHMRTHPTTHALRDREFFIGGLGGEIGRGFFWRATDDDGTPLDPDGLWARMGLPPQPEILPHVARWLDGVRHLPTLLQLDLAYLELRMGCWGFAPSYASVTPLRLHPLISRRSFVAMLSLPPDWRRMQDRSNRMIQAVVRQGWPELLDLPISRYGDYRDRTGLVLRALRQPHLVTKKLRKMFG